MRKNPKIIVAVSGGVDSVVLLHKLVNKTNQPEIIVAHVDHGIRPDSIKDAELVESLAQENNLTFESKQLKLGPGTSEETARDLRYKFLKEVKLTHKARAIYLAHHQDDIIETAMINLLRGTNRRGLTSLKETDEIKRPLLDLTKAEIVSYAITNDLTWREDSTNYDFRYLRNYIRQILPSKLTPKDRRKLLSIIKELRSLNNQIDEELAGLANLLYHDSSFKRQDLIDLPPEIVKELLLFILRNEFDEFYISSERLNEASDFIKNKNTGKQLELNGRLSLILQKGVVLINYRL